MYRSGTNVPSNEVAQLVIAQEQDEGDRLDGSSEQAKQLRNGTLLRLRILVNWVVTPDTCQNRPSMLLVRLLPQSVPQYDPQEQSGISADLCPTTPSEQIGSSGQSRGHRRIC